MTLTREMFPPTREISLDRIDVKTQQIVLKSLVDAKLSIRGELEYLVEYMALELEGYVWGETFEVVEIKYPLDWVEAFKERWFPNWLRKRFPVMYKTHKVDVKVLYPELKYSVPNGHRTLHLLEAISVDDLDVDDYEKIRDGTGGEITAEIFETWFPDLPEKILLDFLDMDRESLICFKRLNDTDVGVTNISREYAKKLLCEFEVLRGKK